MEFFSNLNKVAPQLVHNNLIITEIKSDLGFSYVTCEIQSNQTLASCHT